MWWRKLKPFRYDVKYDKEMIFEGIVLAENEFEAKEEVCDIYEEYIRFEKGDDVIIQPIEGYVYSPKVIEMGW